jgi:hypothetical protein
VSSREARQSYVPVTFVGCTVALPPAWMFDMSNLLVQRTNFRGPGPSFLFSGNDTLFY